MLLHAEDLFRLDAVIEGDTLRTVVRNLSCGKLEMQGPVYDDGPHLVLGEASRYEPARSQLEFALGSGSDAGCQQRRPAAQ